MILYNIQCQGTVNSQSSNSNAESHLKVVHILKYDKVKAELTE